MAKLYLLVYIFSICPYKMLRWLRRYMFRALRCGIRRCGIIPACFCLLGTVCLMISIACFTYVLRQELFDNFVKCSEEESLLYISSICQLYHKGQITGSLCRPLCKRRQVEFRRCTNFHAGKRVDIMACSGFCGPGEAVPAVLKSPRANASEMLSKLPAWNFSTEQVPFLEQAGEAIRNSLFWELGFVPFPPDADVTKLVWEKSYGEYTSTVEGQNVALQTIMMLLEQTEYKVGKVLESSGVVPHIYGTCGPLYLQESCPSGLLDFTTVLGVGQATTPSHSWKQRATHAIKLLQLIQHLEQDFSQTLHLCDLKGSNFGVCADGSVKVIDADTVFFDVRMMDTFNNSKCKIHSDCNFFDCGGWCQLDTGRCLIMITNNNLQTTCRDVLGSKFADFLDWGSLLASPPAFIAARLKAELQECQTQTSEENGVPVHKPPLSVLTRLVSLLTESLAEEETSH